MKTIKQKFSKRVAFVALFVMSAFVLIAQGTTMITTNPGENASTEMRIGWHMNEGVTGGFVEYTKRSDAAWANAQRVNGTYTLCTTWNNVLAQQAGDPRNVTLYIRVNKYSAVLAGLESDTEYMYRVGWNTTFSEVRYFKTAGAKEYTFGWISDAHVISWLPGRLTQSMNMVGRLATAAAGSGGLNFMLNTGDITAYGSCYVDWQSLFNHAHFRNYMWVSTLGNHDIYDRTAAAAGYNQGFFTDAHNNPRNGPSGRQNGCTYWFKYGDVLWIVLNNMLSHTTAVENWFEQVIQSNPSKYIFVVQHYQWFNGSGSAGSSGFTRWNTLFDRHGVDIAFAGNDHVYVRSHSLFNGVRNHDPTRGTVYINAPSSDNDRGAAMPTLNDPNGRIAHRWTEGGPTVGGLLVTVGEENVRVRLLDRNGTVRDETEIPAKRNVTEVDPKVSGVSAGNLSAVDIKNPMDVIFNTRMNRTSVEQAISFSPAASASYTWLNDFTLRMDISQLNHSTAYTLTVNGSVAKNATGDKFLFGDNNTEGTNYVLNFTTAAPQPEANIFASELKASPAAPNGNVTFTYTLNAPASQVVISVSNGDQFTINSNPGLTKGINTITRTLNTSTANGDYTWSVKATGIAAHTNTGTMPVKFTDDNANEMKYYSPRGGVVMDKNMDSPFFGRIYIGNSLNATTGGRTTPDGIFILNAALEDVTGQGNSAYQGGVNWYVGSSNTAADLTPYRLSVTQDGEVYIPKNNFSPRAGITDTPGLWIMNPENPAGSFTDAFGNTTVYGRPIQSHLIGSNLYIFDVTYPGAYNISRYDNFSPGRTAAPNSTIFTNPSSIINPEASAGDAIVSFVPDGIGGWWIAQRRATESAANPSLIHINSSGTVDFNSFSDMASANRIGLINRAGLAYDEVRSLIAVACMHLVKVYSVTWTGGVPSIPNAPLYSISIPSSTSGNIDGLEFDLVGNLYVISTASERLTVWALPKANAAENTFTTNAPSSNPVTVGQGIQGVYYVPNGASQQGWNNLSSAFNEINANGIAGDVTLLITENMQSEKLGLINNTDFSITIKSHGGVKRSITFSDGTTANVVGSFVIGCKPGFAFTDIAPAKNITLDSLILITLAASVTNVPIVIVDASTNITIKNCSIEHRPTSGSYAVHVRGVADRTEANIQRRMPANVTIEGNEIINIAGGSAQGIGVLGDGTYTNATLAKNLVIKNNIIRARTRGIWVREIDGVSFTGNQVHIRQTSTGMNSMGFYSTGITGNVYITGNKFLELATGENAGGANFGAKGVYISGGTATYYIENNYFTGFEKISTASGNAQLQGIHTTVANTYYIRHNTFYLNRLTNAMANLSTAPTGSGPSYSAINLVHANTVAHIQNNLFVSNEDRFPNFFVRGNASFTAADNNVFCFEGGATNARMASGTFPSGLKTAASVVFTNTAQGNFNLDILVGSSSERDEALAVPRLPGVLTDIYGTSRWTTTYAGAHEALSFSDAVGISVPTQRQEVRVFPNPIQDIVHIESDFAITAIKLFDLTGRLIMNVPASQTSVDMSGVTAGNYILFVNDIPVRVIKR